MLARKYHLIWMKVCYKFCTVLYKYREYHYQIVSIDLDIFPGQSASPKQS